MVAFAPERPVGWLTPERLAAMPDTLVFHARKKLAATLQKGSFKLLSALADHALSQGWQIEIVEYSAKGQDTALANPRHLHVLMDDRPAYAPNAIHSVPSYLNGYWFFDEIGSRNNSLAHLARFDPRMVKGDEARPLHAALVEKFVRANRSRLPQPELGAEVIVPGSLAFFSQDFKVPKYHRHFMTIPQMIAAAISVRGNRVLYIKPHPVQTPEELATLTAFHDPGAGVIVTTASIHDLLPACDCVLTLTSAVGFEAFLHRKPAVLGGQTDFWQNAVTLTDPARIGAAIDKAVTTHWPYEKFLHWYLKTMCLEDTKANLGRVLTILARKGFAFADQNGLY